MCPMYILCVWYTEFYVENVMEELDAPAEVQNSTIEHAMLLYRTIEQAVFPFPLYSCSLPIAWNPPPNVFLWMCRWQCIGVVAGAMVVLCGGVACLVSGITTPPRNCCTFGTTARGPRPRRTSTSPPVTSRCCSTSAVHWTPQWKTSRLSISGTEQLSPQPFPQCMRASPSDFAPLLLLCGLGACLWSVSFGWVGVLAQCTLCSGRDLALATWMWVLAAGSVTRHTRTWTPTACPVGVTGPCSAPELCSSKAPDPL